MSLYPDYFCFACSKREPIESSTLKTCSKCGLAQYCNKECQIKGWTTHKKTCGILKKAFQRSEVATIWEFAEISQSYHVYEKIANSDLFAKFEEYLVFAYLNLGNMKKAGEVSRPWAARTGGTLFYFLNQLAFNCLNIRNLNNYAMISFNAFYDGLVSNPENSSHYKVAKCDVIMDHIEKYFKSYPKTRVAAVEERCFQDISYIKKLLCWGGDGLKMDGHHILTSYRRYYFANHTRDDVDVSKLLLAYRLQTPRPEVPIVRKEDQQVVVFNLKLTLKHFCTLDGGFFLNCIKRQNNHEKIRETLLTFMNSFHFDEIFYSKFKIPKDAI